MGFLDVSSTVDVTSTSVQNLTYNNLQYSWMAIDLTDNDPSNDAYISMDVSGFLTNYSIDGVEWKNLGTVSKPNARSVRQLLAENPDAAANARYFAYGGVQDWNGATIQLSQFLVSSIEAGNYTPNPNLQINPVSVIGTPTLNPPEMVVSGGDWGLYLIRDFMSRIVGGSEGLQAFNGVVDNNAWYGQSTLTLDPPIDINGKTVELCCAQTSGSIEFNNSGINGAGVTVSDYAFVDITDQLGGATELNRIYIANSGTAIQGIKIDGKLLIDSSVTLPDQTTVTKSMSGTGEVVSTDPSTNTMTLTNNNGGWVTGYYVQTPEKPAIAQTGYLKFSSNGNVTGVTLIPQSPTIMAAANPVLTFPAAFDTGSSPDTELPYPTSLLTRITSSNINSAGETVSSSGVSNTLYPESTSTFLVPACCQVEYTGAGVAQLIANLQTFSGREAEANTDPTDVGSRLTAATTDIDDYIAGL